MENYSESSHDQKVDRNENRKNGLRLANDMSQTVCLFRKYLIARSQHNIGKTNMEESEVINSCQSPRPLLPPKFNRKSLFRPPSLLERQLFPELRCEDSVNNPTKTSFAEKSSTAQLTIFYGGRVNVYDNVSAEKAQEAMLILDGQNCTSKPFIGEASKTDVRAPSYLHSVPKSKAGPTLARKYSLQCFVEKRRDRIINHSPYEAAVLASRSSPSSGTQDREEEAERESRGLNENENENGCPSSSSSSSSSSFLSPFPSRFGYFFPVSANKGSYL
ncbi:Jasmonate-zim domain protein [Parasponia andersonii]|uniref:Protein TIFY n=1 Tax=Parasponia andersonii TaxID=3476 RepID=A0A2P5BJ00_PARAD|nr:Jasmonate-zim domain protein [Parasponia andersonii]